MGFGPIMTHMRMQPWPDRLCMCLTQLYACLRRLLHQLWARVPSLLTVSIECLARLGIRSNAWRARYHNCQHVSIDDEQNQSTVSTSLMPHSISQNRSHPMAAAPFGQSRCQSRVLLASLSQLFIADSI